MAEQVFTVTFIVIVYGIIFYYIYNEKKDVAEKSESKFRLQSKLGRKKVYNFQNCLIDPSQETANSMGETTLRTEARSTAGKRRRNRRTRQPYAPNMQNRRRKR